MTPVEFRKPQPAPTEPGWYYGRLGTAPIIPRLVHGGGVPTAYTLIDTHPYMVDEFTWFGPVMEVKEG